MDTSLDDVKAAYQKFLSGQITLGDFLVYLNRFLDLTDEPEDPPAPPPAPAPAPATTKLVKEK